MYIIEFLVLVLSFLAVGAYICLSEPPVVKEKNRRQQHEEYCRKRAAFYRQERQKAINAFWQKYETGAYPLDALLHGLADEMMFNDGGSNEWSAEFMDVFENVRRRNRAGEQARRSESFSRQQAEDFARRWWREQEQQHEYERQRQQEREQQQHSYQEQQKRSYQEQSSGQQESFSQRYSYGGNVPDAYYRIFGLTPATLTEQSLKKAYRALCLKYHPDRNKQPDAAEKFTKVQKVYEALQKEVTCHA